MNKKNRDNMDKSYQEDSYDPEKDFVVLSDKEKLNAYRFMFWVSFAFLLLVYFIAGVGLYFGAILVTNCFLLTLVLQYRVIIWLNVKKKQSQAQEKED